MEVLRRKCLKWGFPPGASVRTTSDTKWNLWYNAWHRGHEVFPNRQEAKRGGQQKASSLFFLMDFLPCSTAAGLHPMLHRGGRPLPETPCPANCPRASDCPLCRVGGVNMICPTIPANLNIATNDTCFEKSGKTIVTSASGGFSESLWTKSAVDSY